MVSSDAVRFLLDSLPDMVLICAADGTIEACNQRSEALLGYRPDELTGLSVEVLIPPDLRSDHVGYRQGFTQAPRHRPMHQLQDLRALRKDGSLQAVSVALNPVVSDSTHTIVVSIRDNTIAVAGRVREREMYERLLQKHRLESLGTLSRGIAHDFRNLLALVLGYSELALGEMHNEQTSLRNYLQTIQGSCGHLRELSEQILEFAAGREAQPQAVKLNAAVEEIEGLFRGSLPPQSKLRTELARALPDLMVHPAHILQILLNLILNAREAIGMRGGYIAVRTGIEADQVFIEVEDNGRGIDSADREQLLQAFFTTKEAGRGLGLSVVNDIVTNYGGSIRVDGQLGKGAVFTVLFPKSLQTRTGIDPAHDRTAAAATAGALRG